MDVQALIAGFRNPSFIMEVVTVILFLVAIFFSFRVVRLTTETHRRAHVYILIALILALFVVGARVCGFDTIGNVPTANVGNIFSALFFVLGFTLYSKTLIRTIKENDSNSATSTAKQPPITNASGDMIGR